MTSSFFKRTLAGAILLVLAAGCGQTPMAPNRDAALSVALSNLNSLQASLLGASSNEILFHLEGTGAPPGHGVYGPFSMAVSTGSVTITLRVPAGTSPQVLSLQLNNAATHQPLALGAVAIDFSAGVPGGMVVDMGSIQRNCYFTDLSQNPGINNLGKDGSDYTFATDALLAGGVALGTGYDIAFDITVSKFFIEDAYNAPASAKIIAYMGKGEMVDFDGVPPASRFFLNSLQAKAALGAPVTTLEAGDIYCIQGKSLKGGFAWVQITDPGVVGTTGPSMRFRTNTTLPYYAYEMTNADLNNICNAGW